MTNDIEESINKIAIDEVENESIKDKKEREEREFKQFLKDFGKSNEFKAMVKKRQTFLFSTTFIFLALYISLPILTSFTSVLEQKVYGEITLVWIYALSLFAMTIILCAFYISQAKKHDKRVAALIEKYHNGGLT